MHYWNRTALKKNPFDPRAKTMATVITAPVPKAETLADLVRRLGDIPLERIRLQPPPGTATEKDVIAIREGPERRICELVEGVLVEKPIGNAESNLAMILGQLLLNYLDEHDLGTILGPDGALRIMPKLVRIPDISFLSWEKLPGRKLPRKKIADLAPDLAIEILSESNTKKEMQRKVKDYFAAGVKLVWLIQPKNRTAEIYTSPTDLRRIKKDESLNGADVLPGFSLQLSDLFARSAL
jgi:Uma2 family endonuclease